MKKDNKSLKLVTYAVLGIVLSGIFVKLLIWFYQSTSLPLSFELIISIILAIVTGAIIPGAIYFRGEFSKREDETDERLDECEKAIAVIESKVLRISTVIDSVDARTDASVSECARLSHTIQTHERMSFHPEAASTLREVQGVSQRLQAQHEYLIEAIKELNKRMADEDARRK